MLLHLVHSSLLLNIAIVVKIVKVNVNEDTFDHILYFSQWRRLLGGWGGSVA